MVILGCDSNGLSRPRWTDSLMWTATLANVAALLPAVADRLRLVRRMARCRHLANHRPLSCDAGPRKGRARRKSVSRSAGPFVFAVLQDIDPVIGEARRATPYDDVSMGYAHTAGTVRPRQAAP